MWAKSILLGFSVFLASPVFAAERWSHDDTGISIDRASGDLSLVEEQDKSGGAKADNILQFGTANEPATLYLYRSSFPNPALWFPMTRAAMVINMHGLPAAPSAPTPFTTGGASAPNGLRWVTPLPETARARATGVAIVQVGEWILKLRITSRTRDANGVGKRLDTLLAMIHFSAPPPRPLPLTTPAACKGEAWDTGIIITDKPNDDEMGAAMLSATNALFAASGVSGLAREPGKWCKDESVSISSGMISLYRPISGPPQWVMFVGDSGITITAQDLSDYAKTARNIKDFRARAVMLTNNWAGTRVVGFFDNMPFPQTSINLALPVAVGQRPALFSVSTGKTPKTKGDAKAAGK